MASSQSSAFICVLPNSMKRGGTGFTFVAETRASIAYKYEATII
jgi:hypothetical protein